MREAESPPAVRVYDARNGKLLREVPAGPRKEGLVPFARRSREGDSLLLDVRAPDLRYKKARLARLTRGGQLVTVGEESLHIVEAGGVWYAADEWGRRLSAFDREGRQRRSREIAAPAALRSDDHHARPPVKGIYAIPDGARVVVIVGEPVGLMNSE